jgi:1,4-alpha-glucan branching enzyme
MFTIDGVPMLFTGNELADADERHSMFGKTPMDWSQLEREPGRSRHALVKRLAEIRRDIPAFTDLNGADGLSWLDTTADGSVTAFVRRESPSSGVGTSSDVGRAAVIVVQNWTTNAVSCDVSFKVPPPKLASYLAEDRTDRDVKGVISADPVYEKDAKFTSPAGFELGPWGCWISRIEPASGGD